MNAYVVEVNECRVFATRQGADWWNDFRRRFHGTDRITDVTVSLGGNLCHVAADTREDAAWLVSAMVAQGLPASALRVVAVKS